MNITDLYTQLRDINLLFVYQSDGVYIDWTGWSESLTITVSAIYLYRKLSSDSSYTLITSGTGTMEGYKDYVSTTTSYDYKIVGEVSSGWKDTVTGNTCAVIGNWETTQHLVPFMEYYANSYPAWTLAPAKLGRERLLIRPEDEYRILQKLSPYKNREPDDANSGKVMSLNDI